jgi:hypothetical protein
MEIPASDSTIRELVINVLGIILGSNNESDFGKVMEGMPTGLKNQHAACILCQRLSQFLLHDWIPESLEKIRQVLRPTAEVLQTQPGAETYGSEVIVNLSKEVN